ncbi:MAG: aspartate carbamoyltransferase, partial [Candidatus Eisenbacteria bacterium]|nr:aspartate carbamoyltransferase [Candidatus Eisenbacteria bacterium]
LEEALETCQVVNVLRLQLERMTSGYLPSLREYARIFGVDSRRMEKAADKIMVMHPGPMTRGVEIDPAVADGPNSVILDQVTNGVAVRMAVLFLVWGGAPASEMGSEIALHK